MQTPKFFVLLTTFRFIWLLFIFYIYNRYLYILITFFLYHSVSDGLIERLLFSLNLLSTLCSLFTSRTSYKSFSADRLEIKSILPYVVLFEPWNVTLCRKTILDLFYKRFSWNWSAPKFEQICFVLFSFISERS